MIKVMICPDCDWVGEIDTSPHRYISKTIFYEPLLLFLEPAIYANAVIWMSNRRHRLEGFHCQKCKTGQLIPVESMAGEGKSHKLPLEKQECAIALMQEHQNKQKREWLQILLLLLLLALLSYLPNLWK
jgi:hypothetical protein